MKLRYLSNARLPSLMAHGLQITQNCEALTEAGAEVSLWCPYRVTPADERHLNRDVWAHYGVRRVFRIRRLPCIDLTWLPGAKRRRLADLLFFLQFGTFALAAVIGSIFAPAEVYYSRDPLTLLLLGFVKPRARLVYESHRLNNPGRGAWLQRQVLRRCALTIAITPPLRDGLEQRQAANPVKSRIIVLHDGIRRERFAAVIPQAEARQQVGWSESLFIVGYVGRLQTLGMDKGLDTVIDAAARLPAGAVALAIVGGPAAMVDAYRARWTGLGLPETHFLYGGQVPPEAVPLYLSAFDACILPLPWTEHFAYHTSSLKLFEYMASGRVTVASALPSFADVLRDDENALLFPPSDVAALAAVLDRLRGDPALRERLAAQAYADVMQHYTWDARARQIMAAIRGIAG